MRRLLITVSVVCFLAGAFQDSLHVSDNVRFGALGLAFFAAAQLSPYRRRK